jgi:hypothetical protein
MTTRQPLAPLSVSLPLATPVAPAATLRYAAPQTPSFAVPATPNAGDTTGIAPCLAVLFPLLLDLTISQQKQVPGAQRSQDIIAPYSL